MKHQPSHPYFLIDGQCAGPSLCPLTHVQPGRLVSIKRLDAGPELTDRLRELGFCEQQKIKVLSRQSTFICQVCNARLGISPKLAESILVEPLSPARPTEVS